MKVLILAAGMGNRLGNITENKPKALVEVANVALIDRIIDFVQEPNVTQIGVVGGYCFNQLKEHLNDRNILIFENPNFRDGNITTLLSALDFFDDDILMTNVDHIYPKEMLKHVLKNSKGISAICDFDRQLQSDDMKVKLNESGKLKKISKELSDYEAGYIGMTYISKDMNKIYKQAAKDSFKIYGKDSCVEFVLGHLAANDIEINICDTSNFKWFEVDTQEDLEIAENAIKKG